MMAFIDYVPYDEIPESDQVADRDNIIQIHGVHSQVISRHYDLYRELMYGQGPLTRIQREMIAVVVSTANKCHY
jgi:alkylhydroperoxidase family enzyme